MKILKRVIQAVLLLIMLVMIGGLILLSNVKKKAIPDYAADVDIENLHDEVVVYRDSLAIPHIYAKNEEDLYRVVGYLQAQDRLWQMDLMRRITTGRLAEIFGEDMITADQLFRSFNLSKKSRDIITKTDPEIIKCMEAYCDGVNQFIERNSKKLSFEFTLIGYKPEPWTLIHSLNLIGYMGWDLTSGKVTDIALFKIAQHVSDSLLRELIPDIALQKSFVYPEYMDEYPELISNTMIDEGRRAIDKIGVQVFQASNNWAVSGNKSVSGQPLLANDMHLDYMSPGIWYQMHQVVEGKLNVTGVAVPGQPYIVCGHNEDIAWGMTNITIDNIDYYLETINPQDTNQYKLNGRWVDMRIVEETIPVSGGEPVKRINRYTHRGPIVSEFNGITDKTISARWIGMDFSNEVRSLHIYNRARNWEEFREGARTFLSTSQNIVYADKEGNIGLQAAGGVPIRPGEPCLIFPGDTTEFDWIGVVPFEEMPYTYNPECGYVSSANNKTVGPDYPYYIGTWYANSSRIDRIRELLNEKEKYSVRDFQEIQSDQVSVLARKLVPFYLGALSGKYEGIEAEAVKLLEEWDYDMDKDEAAPLIFEQMYIQMIHALYEDEVGPKLIPEFLEKQKDYIARFHLEKIADGRESGWIDNVNTTDKEESISDIIHTAFEATIDTISNRIGEEISTWKWGDVHTLTIMHPMGGVDLVAKLFEPNLGPYRAGGGYHTVAPFAYPLIPGWFETNHGASQRHVFSIANWDVSKTVIPTGTSGIPASPYYGNQTDLYMNFKYHDDPFSKEAVMERAKYVSVFK